MKNKFILFCILILTSCASVKTQSTSIVGRPKGFEKPVDLFETPGRLAELYRNELEKTTDAWLVVCDRENNPTFDRPNGTQQKKTLQFLEHYYVIKEQGEWIQIATGRPNGLTLTSYEDCGWVHKGKMLLWTAGMIDARTSINEKTFLLNKVEDIDNIIQMERKEIVPLYKDPKTNTRMDDIFIYSFYFVYKKENFRYLIGKEYKTNQFNIKRVLIGWVDERRCANWNTRICVEPNFSKVPFDERSQNNKLRLVAYKDRQGAQAHASSGIIAKDKIYFDQDPAGIPGVITARSNPNRYPGSVVRFPLLSSSDGNADFFRTGVIGEIKVKDNNGNIDFISTSDWTKMFEKYKIENKKFENYDVLFVIEGTEQMNEFKNAIAKGMEQVLIQLSDVKNLRIGALIYRDPINASAGRFIEVKKMTPAALGADVINWVKEMPFSNFGEQDPYTGLYFGLNKALTEADLAEQHTNIVFLIGNNADFRSDQIRKSVAEENNDPTLIGADGIADNLAFLGAHVYAIQCKNNDDHPSTAYAKQVHNFLIENAKKQYNAYNELKKYYPDMGIDIPFLPNLETNNKLELTKSAIPGVLYKPAKGSALSTAQITEHLKEAAQKSKEHLTNTNNELIATIEKGDKLERNPAAGGFSPGILPFLQDIIRKSQISKEGAQNLTDFKYQLYAEVWVPKQIRAAKNPSCSYILFMPERDLADYIRELQRFVDAVGDGTYYEKRQKLFDAMWTLAKKLAGETNLQREEAEGLSLNQFISLIQGVKREGLVLVDREQDFLLSDINRETTMSNEQLDAFIYRIIEKKEQLSKILQQGKNYEFAYSTGSEVYFWIPVEDSF